MTPTRLADNRYGGLVIFATLLTLLRSPLIHFNKRASPALWLPGDTEMKIEMAGKKKAPLMKRGKNSLITE